MYVWLPLPLCFVAGTLTQNDMAVVRMWAGGRDYTQLQNLNNPFNPPSRLLSTLSRGGSEELTGTGSTFLSASLSNGAKAELPLGLDQGVHRLITEGIALNSNASLRFEEAGASGTYISTHLFVSTETPPKLTGA